MSNPCLLPVLASVRSCPEVIVDVTFATDSSWVLTNLARTPLPAGSPHGRQASLYYALLFQNVNYM